MKRIVLIGGTGAAQLVPPENTIINIGSTPHGKPSGPMLEWQTGDLNFLYIARHGPDGTIPPHLVNYKANLWIARELQPDCVIGLNAVGGIAKVAHPARLIFPDQLIDYTWGREHSFDDGSSGEVMHIDFTEPYDLDLRLALIEAANASHIPHEASGVHAVTQGPRLETAAEITRLARDGCDVVGMTGMPEASLARELGLAYSSVCMVVNPAAGLGDLPISIDMMHEILRREASVVRQLLQQLLVDRYSS
jgi:5'-methylthioinosine phosphorylase